MPCSPSTDPLLLIPHQPWAGTIDFYLMNNRRWRVATIYLMADSDNVTLRYSTNDLDLRPLDIINRDTFHHWLNQPLYPLIGEHTIWASKDTSLSLTLTLYHGLTYQLPAAITDRLHQVI